LDKFSLASVLLPLRENLEGDDFFIGIAMTCHPKRVMSKAQNNPRLEQEDW